MTKAKVSTNSISKDALITLYANSPEVNVLSPSYVALLRDNAIASTTDSYISSESLDIPDETDLTADVTSVDSTQAAPVDANAQNPSINAPSLSDISILSSEIIYDSSGNPSVTLTIRIKNSNSLAVKSVNAKVQVV